MAEKLTYMIAGLGNPGKTYSQTRHNMGFLVIDELARRHSFSLSQSKFDAELGKGRVDSHNVFLIKPMSYMNRSGFPLQKISAYFSIPSSNLIVVHDELDLPYGRVMVVKGRGHGGHNGIRSIIEVFGHKAFIRIRVGVGRPQHQSGNVTGHVLGKFSQDEQSQLQTLVEDCADVCEMILSKGVTQAMNYMNSKR